MEPFRKYIKLFSIIISSILVFAILLFLLYQHDNKYTSNTLQPINGMLILNETDLQQNDIYFLNNGWEYYPEVLLTPDTFVQNTPDAFMQFVTIGQYNNFSLGNAKKRATGSATYRLTLSLPEESTTYLLALPEIFSAYKLYINGTLLMTMGNPTPESYKPNIGNRVVSFTASGNVELIISVSNFSHYYSGITYPPIFGEPHSVLQLLNIKLLIAITILVIALLCSILAFYFSYKSKQITALLYGLLCICMIGYTFYPILYTYFNISTRLWYNIEIFCTYAMYLLMIVLQEHILKVKTKYRYFIYSSLGIFCVFSIIYSTGSFDQPMIFSMYSLCSFLIKILVASYLLWTNLKGGFHEESTPKLLLGCTSIFAFSLFADRIVPLYEPIYGFWFQTYGGLCLIICIGYILWHELTAAYTFQLTYGEEKRQLTKQITMQKTHYLDLTNKIEESIQQRHDLRHHLRMLYGFMEHHEFERAMEYLRKYDVSVSTTKRIVLCKNLILDAILQYYKALCEQKQITFDSMVCLPEQLSFTDTDLSIIFSNLLENAYEASIQEKSPFSHIRIEAKLRQNNLLLRVENHFSNDLNLKNGTYLSTKHSGNGIGTESVKAVVQKYNGIINFESNENIFRVTMILPLNHDN